MTIAQIFLCFEILVSNLCWLPTFCNISLCYAFWACMKVKISTCSQLVWWGFLTYTSIVNSKFWLTIFFLTFWFFLGGLDAFSLDCEHGWSTKTKKRYYESCVHIALVSSVCLSTKQKDSRNPYPHSALVCFVCLCAKWKDSRNLFTFVLRIEGFKKSIDLCLENWRIQGSRLTFFWTLLNSSSYPDIELWCQ
jgi:hypothetical protein